MIRLAVCEDDAGDRRVLGDWLTAYVRSHPQWDMRVALFASPLALLAKVRRGTRFELYLLDMMMPEMDGIELAAAIRRQDRTALFCYLTSSPDYALRAYQVKARAYLLKPIARAELYAALDEMVAGMQVEAAARLPVHTKTGVQAVPFAEIVCIEHYKHRLYCRLIDKTVLESVTLRKPLDVIAAPLFADGRFLKISASHVINMQYVVAVRSGFFELADGEILPVTRAYADAKRRYLDYVLREEGEEK